MLTIIFSILITIFLFIVYTKNKNKKLNDSFYGKVFFLVLVSGLFGLIISVNIPEKSKHILHEYELIAIEKDKYVEYMEGGLGKISGYRFVYKTDDDTPNTTIISKDDLIVRETSDKPLYVIKEKIKMKNKLINLFTILNHKYKYIVYIPKNN